MVYYYFSMYMAKNSIIVSLFEALSHVTCPICYAHCEVESDQLMCTCLVRNPSRSMILNKALPSLLPLCALLSHTKPNKALCSSQILGCGSSIQCPVTAKYPSVFDACQALHVRLTSPWTNLLCKLWSCKATTS